MRLAISRGLLTALAAVAAAASGACAKRAQLPPPDGDATSGIERAISTITPGGLERDVRALPGPRHPASSPEALLAAAEYVSRTFELNGLHTRRLPVTHEGFTAPVIIGRAGAGTRTGPARVLVIAHYDTVKETPGADDNTSGIAGLLAIARALRESPPAAPVELLAVPFEEQGLHGSRAIAQSLTAGERDALQAVFVLEMIGYVNGAPDTQRYPPGLGLLFPGRRFPKTADFIAAFGERARPRPVEALEAARSFVPELRVETLLLPGPVAKMRDMRRSDHAPFWELELPAAFVGDTANFRSPHYHRETDAPETLDFTFAARSAQWVTAAVLLVAGVSPGGDGAAEGAEVMKQDEPSAPDERPGRKGDPEPIFQFEAGPPVTDTAALTAWLEANRGARLRLPVILERGAPGHGFRRARVGEVALRVTDLALGIPLSERIAQRCGRDAQRCALWLEGRYGEPAAPPTDDERPQFEVLKVGEVVDEQTALRAERAS